MKHLLVLACFLVAVLLVVGCEREVSENTRRSQTDQSVQHAFQVRHAPRANLALHAAEDHQSVRNPGK